MRLDYTRTGQLFPGVPPLCFKTNFNNKLDCRAFTTLRLGTQKYSVNDVYETLEGQTSHGLARVAAVKTMKFKDLKDTVCYIDTGYSALETQEMIVTMYKNIAKITPDTLFTWLLLVRDVFDTRKYKQLNDLERLAITPQSLLKNLQA